MEKQNVWQDTYAKARSGLLIMLFLTVANLATVVLMKSETVFLFTAAIPELALSLFLGVYYSPEQQLYLMVLASVLLAASLCLYFLCWLLCKRRRGWMTVALVTFAVDCAVLLGWLCFAAYQAHVTGGTMDLLVTVVRVLFAGWILYYLVRGVKAAKTQE